MQESASLKYRGCRLGAWAFLLCSLLARLQPCSPGETDGLEVTSKSDAVVDLGARAEHSLSDLSVLLRCTREGGAGLASVD